MKQQRAVPEQVGEKNEAAPPAWSKMSKDEQVVKRFTDVIQSKVDNGMLRKIRGKERNVLVQQITPGLYIGSAIGILQFIVLRKAPVMLMNRLLKRQYVNGSGSSSKTTTTATTTGAQQMEGSATVKKNPFSQSSSNSSSSSSAGSENTEIPKFEGESWKLRPFTLLFDAGLSMLTTIAVWMAVTDKQKLFDATADIPLLEGRSDVSDALCDDFLHVHSTVSGEFWNEEAKDDVLIAIRRFVKNCEKRRAYENKVLRERGELSEHYCDDDDLRRPRKGILLPSSVPEDILEEEGLAGSLTSSGSSLDWAARDEDFEEDDFDSA